MSNVPRQALRDIIAKHGTGVCSDARRCEGLLRDNCGAYRREISILINALEERVPLDLLAGINSAPRDLLLARLAKRLEDNLALTEAAAIWAVETWALALNVISDAEIARRENKRAEDQKQKSESDSLNKIQEADRENSAPKIAAPKKQPSKPPAKTYQPPVFAPPVNPSPQPNIALGRQNAPNQMSPAATGNAPPQTRQPQTADPQARSKRRPRRFRGCLIGCFLLLVLFGILAVGVPYAFRVMRETQQQSEPPRFPQQ